MDNPLLIWAILCLLAAVVLFLIELLVPSAGILGMLASLCLVASIVMFFGVNWTLGLVMSIVSLAALPFLFALAIRVWPSTPLARLLTLGNPNQSAETLDEDPTAGAVSPNQADELIGAQGVALNDLHPVGSCRFGQRKYDCIAEGSFIEKGAPVRAVGWSGAQVKVRLRR